MRMKILRSDTRCPPTISANTNRNDRVCYIEQDAFLHIDSTEVDSGRANTIAANSITNTYDATNSDALHPTPNGDSEHLPVMNNYQATRKRANSQLILRYYVESQLFSLEMATGCPNDWHWGPTNSETTGSRGNLFFIDHLCTGEEDACNLNFELL